MANTIKAVCFDSGDTLVDEGTEVRELDVVVAAELIGGAATTVRTVKALGYPLALVADGLVASFTRVLGYHQLLELFDAVAISEVLGVEKPHPRMFRHALEQLGVGEHNYNDVLMVGNHLTRDIGGANALGLTSVWLDWSPRRSKEPGNALEVPNYVIYHPLELLGVVAGIEAGANAADNSVP